MTGRPIAEFWSLTFREIHLVLSAEAEARILRQQDLIYAAFTGESLHRMRRLPKLRTILPIFRERRVKPNLDGMRKKLEMWRRSITGV